MLYYVYVYNYFFIDNGFLYVINLEKLLYVSQCYRKLVWDIDCKLGSSKYVNLEV